MTRTVTRKTGFYLFDDMQALDAVGPLEVLYGVNEVTGETAYEFHLFSDGGRPVQSRSGLQLGPCLPLEGLHEAGPLDTFFVPGGEGTFQEYKKPALHDLIRHQHEQVRRLCSVCSGSVVLAEAGLLDGKRATSHWAICPWMARTYPDVRVDPDAIFVKEGSLYTSAGVTAGMDLALALVEEDHGLDVALDVARRKVMFMKRPGGQSQFSAHLKAQFQEKEKDRYLVNWILSRLADPLTIADMAQEAGMSERSFARYFVRTFGVTPARYLENCRIESARRLLEESRYPLEQVAGKCGFRSAEIMRRSFQRHLHISPADYRQRFSSHSNSGLPDSEGDRP